MILNEIVEHVTELARTCREPQPDTPQTTQEIDPSPFPERSQDADDSGVDDRPSPAEVALRDYLSILNDKQVYLLVMTMYIGRDDIAATNWRNAIGHVMDTFGSAERARRHVYRKGPLADCLQEGLKRLAAAGVDLDAIPDELFEKSAVVT